MRDVAQDLAGAVAAGVAEVVFHQAAQDGCIRLALATALRAVPDVDVVARLLFRMRRHAFQFNHRQVDAVLERAFRIPHIRHAARHAGREVAACRAQHHDRAARHVFAAMVARAFHDPRHTARCCRQ
ncbi:hypothetical protein G6F63_015237 [Rhizopus arrhizus]|nr:hypothetical protein G6F63_015237 [Rhizopus arrhizus]